MKNEDVVEYMRKSNGTQKIKGLNVTVYAYKRGMERVRKKKMEVWTIG